MKTPTTVLLVVIAALLAVNLIPATAQQPPDFLNPPEPTVVGIAAFNQPGGGGAQIASVYRIWSDGTVEGNIKRTGCGGWCGWTTVPE